MKLWLDRLLLSLVPPVLLLVLLLQLLPVLLPPMLLLLVLLLQLMLLMLFAAGAAASALPSSWFIFHALGTVRPPPDTKDLLCTHAVGCLLPCRLFLSGRQLPRPFVATLRTHRRG